jgi:hypothetical protein
VERQSGIIQLDSIVHGVADLLLAAEAPISGAFEPPVIRNVSPFPGIMKRIARYGF